MSLFWKNQANGFPVPFKINNYLLSEKEYESRELRLDLDKDIFEIILKMSEGEVLAECTLALTSLYLIIEQLTGAEKIILETNIPNILNKQQQSLLPLFLNFCKHESTIKEHIIETKNILVDAINNQIPFVHQVLGLESDTPRVSDICFFYGNIDEITDKIKAEFEIIAGFSKLANGSYSLFITGKLSNTPKFYEELINGWKHFLNSFTNTSKCLHESAFKISSISSNHNDFWFNGGFVYNEQGNNVIEVFKNVCSKNSKNTAVETPTTKITYEELDNISDQVAEYLLKKINIKKGDVVAVISERNENIISGMLGVMKAGAVYLNINQENPIARINEIVQDANVKVILVESKILNLVSSLTNIPLGILDMQFKLNMDFNFDCNVVINEEDLAYFVYTSGTTGKPKGVPINHGGILNSAYFHTKLFEVNPTDVYLQFMSTSFDGSILDILTTLLGGASLLLLESTIYKDIHIVNEFIREKKVNITTMIPSYLNLIDQDNLNRFKIIVSAGESFGMNWMKDLNRDIRVFNGYGPSEVAVNSTIFEIDTTVVYKNIPIGKISPNKEVFIVDKKKNSVAKGVIGEILIGGKGLTSGYHNDQKLTDEKIITTSLYADNLYSTGDMGAWTESEEIIFLGRFDNQIKINGFRVELGEINYAIESLPSVKRSHVMMDKTTKTLVAFIENISNVSVEALQMSLSKILPNHMVPGKFLLVDKLPLTINLKIDERALQQLITNEKETDVKLEMSPSESKIFDLFREILKSDYVPVDKSFFALGGDSIKVIQLVQKANQKGLLLDTSTIIEHETVRDIARIIDNRLLDIELDDSNKKIDIKYLERWDNQIDFSLFERGVEEVFPVLDIQKVMIEKSGKSVFHKNGIYYCKSLWRIKESNKQIDVVKSAIQQLYKEFPNLRQTFYKSSISGELFQVILSKNDQFLIEIIDLKNSENKEDIIDELWNEVSNFKIDDHLRPFSTFKILDVCEDEFILEMSVHHVCIDGWSAVEIKNRFFEIYKCLLNNMPIAVKIQEVTSQKEAFIIQHRLLDDIEIKKYWDWKIEQFKDKKSVLWDENKLSNPYTKLFSLSNSIAANLVDIAKREDVSLKLICLAVQRKFNSLIQSGASEINVVCNGRSESLSDPLKATGLFWNFQPLIFDDGEETNIRNIYDQLNELEQYAAYPYSKIMSFNDGNEISSFCFNFVSFHNQVLVDSSDITLLEYRSRDRFHFPFTCTWSVDPSDQSNINLRIETFSEFIEPDLLNHLLTELNNKEFFRNFKNIFHEKI
ncbi:amino acid adenylation domain-containing protein [Flavobacterium sp.]|uniref:amino acid adenylation domain-containing protein n=1 Tax=Flavobacterium sp. TaxID=239 RepID=UPI003D11799B